MNRLSNTSILKVAALVGVLMALLLLASTVSAQPADRSYRYKENGTDPVATFRATTDVKWTVAGADDDDFSISASGVLTFKSSPNYEKGRAGDFNNDGDWDDTIDGVAESEPTTVALKNTYTVDIVANGTTLVNATVRVTDVDDAGVVTLSHLQPAEKVDYMATAIDEDDGYRDTATNMLHTEVQTGDTAATVARWKWEKSQSGTAGWSTIPDATSSTYTPKTADVGYYLRVTVTYSDRDLATDAVANAPIRTAMKVSEYTVKAENNTNQAPAFADDEKDTEDTKEQDRAVDENDKNAAVGAPVRARDADVLHYSIANAADDSDDTTEDEMASAFNIDRATGQISVKGTLSHETAEKYRVKVTAKDPFNADDEVTVTITVNDLNDAPVFGTAGSTKGVVTENTRDATATPPTGAPLLADDPSTTETETYAYTYTATDEDHYDGNNDSTLDADENESVTYSLAGADKSAFMLDTTTTAGSAILGFKGSTKVNFEKKDSYSVTIVATDQRKMTKTKSVTVKVIDAEDAATINLSTRQPQVGQPITADLTDEDGVKGSITWAWTKAPATVDGDGNVSPCPAAGDSAYVAITGGAATRDEKATFTPLPRDVDTDTSTSAVDFGAFCLQVTATYRDGFNVDPTSPTDDTLSKPADSPILPRRQSNSSPVFMKDGKKITSTTRMVVEDGDQPRTAAQMNVGAAVSAEDPDDKDDGPDGTSIKLNDNLTYSLKGADAASFGIAADSGQIMTKAKLDYETKRTYNVIVRATDGSRAATDIPVTISITNVNEKPVVSGDATVSFQENAKRAVGTYTADDPEEDAFTWSLKPDNNDDAGKFKIDKNTGVLSFKSPPNFESMGDGDNNNIYEVTVRATDTVDNRGEKKVEVTVTDVDDMGRITLDAEQPGVGVALTATLIDDDKRTDKPESATWQWERGASADGAFADIDNATSEAYTPGGSDADMFLRVTASYGSRSNPKTVSKVSAHPVKARDVANPLPVFPDQEPESTDTRETDQDREVPENSPTGTLVGAPVTAQDDDVLTYTIFDNHDDPDATPATTTPSKLFTIDQATGQIKVGSAKLNYEGGDETPPQNLYRVTVTATDPSNAQSDVKVTIIVTNVDEKPDITSPAAGGEGDEMAAPETQTIIDADGEVPSDLTTATAETYSTVGGATFTAAAFTAVDHEDDDVTWSLEGADADKFEIDKDTGILSFKSKPDFEAEGSAAGNNRYRVTIVAADEAGNASRESVKVDVKNVNEPGKIKINTVQPQVGVPLTATLTDPDGVVGKVNWTWTLETPTVPATSPYTKEESATSTWTPPEGTGDVTVAVCYNDALSGNQACPTGTGTPASTPRTITQIANDADISNTYDIRAKQPSNSRPEFKNDEDEKITRTTRSIEENNEKNEAVGEAVQAEDSDTGTAGTADANNNLTYTLSGPDAASFTIDRGEPAANGADTASDTRGQIMAKNVLDYETKNRYMVTVTATDGSGASASIEVTIMVTDVVNEPPKLAPPAPVVSGDAAPSYAENGTGAVGTYTVSPAAATLSLGGADMAAFSLDSNGELSFRTSPDYEAPTDADGNNVYMVTITGTEGNTTGSRDVAVTVTNVDEDGTVSFDLTEPSVGTPITASLTDPDGGVTSVTWQWQRSDDQGDFSDIADATSATYTPVEADAGNDLRAMASYTDGHGPGKSATSVAHQVSQMRNYDADGDGSISKEEALQAVADYFAGHITKEQVLAVIAQYFAS